MTLAFLLTLVGMSLFLPGKSSNDVNGSSREVNGKPIQRLRRTMNNEDKKPNRLIGEKSPYLLQHAFNPVDWYPWGEEAFAKARSEQKPIFLSIGYSTCHWCHVMEHESFENDSIAALMNRDFVCIKVDREERPDIDKVYMAALQAMGQNGGWPMSMFLTPDLKPFFGGTYFPPEGRYGRIGFPELLGRVREIWETQRDKALDSAEGITTFLRTVSIVEPGAVGLDETVMDTCFEQMRKNFDPSFGGFGEGPKFPRPAVFAFLLRYYKKTRNGQALEMAERTLKKMAEGGIYDHVGGGFHRYSVDGEWRVPHFEKMLYDQAQLTLSYLDLYQITRDGQYARVAREILEYVMRDMTDPGGGFYSAEDADSPRPEDVKEIGEGACYLWSKKEILANLGKEHGEIFSFHYGVEESGNAPNDPQHEFTGHNILYIARARSETAKHFSKPETEVQKILEEGRSILFEERAGRPKPHLDDKILTSWNGLMLSAFARGYQILDDQRYLMAAERAAEFVWRSLLKPGDGRLHRRYRDGEAKFDAHLDDYAFLVQGLLDLYEASFDLRFLEHAVQLTEKQILLFQDKLNGGFFDTSGEDPAVLVRMKEQYDGAEPTGNAVAAMNLLRLTSMTANADWRKQADAVFTCFSSVLRKQPSIMPQMVAALDYSMNKVKQIVLVGSRDSSEMHALLREVRSRYLPNKIVLLVGDQEVSQALAELFPFASTLTPLGGKPTAYVCEDYVCRLPTTDWALLRGLLD